MVDTFEHTNRVAVDCALATWAFTGEYFLDCDRVQALWRRPSTTAASVGLFEVEFAPLIHSPEVWKARMQTILVVHDCPDVAELEAGLVVDGGRHATIAPDGEEALAILAGIHVDPILLELDMPRKGPPGPVLSAGLPGNSADLLTVPI